MGKKTNKPESMEYALVRGEIKSGYGVASGYRSSCSYRIKKPKYYLKNIDWSDYIPPENFYFFDVTLHYHDKTYQGLVYMPDPETKADHVQIPNMLELILPKIKGLEYGLKVDITLKKEQLDVIA